jgi:hypothetical protein
MNYELWRYVAGDVILTSYVSESTRGNTWYMVETFCLIDCWADDEIEADLSGTGMCTKRFLKRWGDMGTSALGMPAGPR